MEETIRAAEQLVGHTFAKPELLGLALTHASNAENKLSSNERMEFLGDAVLGVVVCEAVFLAFPHFREGEMTKIKSQVVSRETCATVAQSLGLERLLVLGKGMQTSGPLPASLSAAALEAVIGAIFLDAGFDVAAAFVRRLFVPLVERAARSGHQQNFKSVLQQHAQQALGCTPAYRTLDEQGPDHSKCFKVAVEINGRRFEPSWGATKKKAEQEAALNALKELGLVQELEGELRICEPPPSAVEVAVDPAALN
jgi:ribonuclease III